MDLTNNSTNGAPQFLPGFHRTRANVAPEFEGDREGGLHRRPGTLALCRPPSKTLIQVFKNSVFRECES